MERAKLKKVRISAISSNIEGKRNSRIVRFSDMVRKIFRGFPLA